MKAPQNVPNVLLITLTLFSNLCILDFHCMLLSIFYWIVENYICLEHEEIEDKITYMLFKIIITMCIWYIWLPFLFC